MNTLRRPSPAPPARNAPRAPRPVAPAPETARPSTYQRPVKPVKPRKKGPGIFGLIDRMLRLEGFFRDGVPVRFLPPVLWGMGLVLLYIANSHFADRTIRAMDRVKRETEDYRADFTTLKSDYMKTTIQSEVARRVASLGMVESKSPPYRIVLRGAEADSVIVPEAQEEVSGF